MRLAMLKLADALIKWALRKVSRDDEVECLEQIAKRLYDFGIDT